MGILDDAIREHLELIRRRGATDSEVQRLEDEAFGPPTRPDEADFPESEESPAASANGVATEQALGDPHLEGGPGHEDVTTLMPSAGGGEEGGEPGTGLEEPTGAHIAAEPESEDMLIDHQEEPAAEGTHEEVVSDVEGEEPVASPEHAEDAAQEHAILEPPAGGVEDHGAEEHEEQATLYDQAGEDAEPDVGLPAEEEALAPEPPSEEEPIAEPEGTAPLEPPIESLDTVEHPFDEEIVEEDPHEAGPPSEEYEEQAPAVHPEEEDEEQDEEQGDDVLADTPEFLKDAPEDDELWFEQGEPKDFDF